MNENDHSPKIVSREHPPVDVMPMLASTDADFPRGKYKYVDGRERLSRVSCVGWELRDSRDWRGKLRTSKELRWEAAVVPRSRHIARVRFRGLLATTTEEALNAGRARDKIFGFFVRSL